MLRPMDTVARFGGDEFTVLFEDLAASEEAVLIAERIGRAAATPIRLEDRSHGHRQHRDRDGHRPRDRAGDRDRPGRLGHVPGQASWPLALRSRGSARRRLSLTRAA